MKFTNIQFLKNFIQPLLFTLLFLSITVSAQIQFPETAKITLRSELEGQFIVKGIPFTPTIAPSSVGGMRFITTDTRLNWPKSVRLDPSTAIVICERIKEILLQELGLTDQWKGLIEIDIDFYPNGINRPILLSHQFLNDGFHTTMKVSDEVTPHRFIQAVVQVLLLEIANRSPYQKKATTIPLWMIEGMTQLIMQKSGPALIPISNTRKTFSTIMENPVKKAKSRIRTLSEPPDFNYLAFPSDKTMSGVQWMIFQDAALIFTYELLSLPEGKSCFCQTLFQLKNYKNWHLAFLSAWKKEFKELSDLEKWWALVIVSSQKDTSPNSWTIQQSLIKLNDILSESAVASVYDINTLRAPNTIHLQMIAEHWTPLVQIYFFERIASQLKAFEMVAHPTVADLAERYRTTITDYIYQPRLYAFLGKDSPSRSDLRLLKKRLNHLDSERNALGASLPPMQTAPQYQAEN